MHSNTLLDPSLRDIKLPPGAILNPTRDQLVAMCQPLGIRIPAKIPKGGWLGPIFMSASASRDPVRAAIIAAHPVLEYCRARGLKMRREGREWTCLCPLHEEHTPSFKVNPDKQLFCCHGCGAGGSVIELHAALEGIPIEDAKRELGGGSKQQQRSRDEVAVYVYRDEDGYPLFEVVRFAPKDFRQFRLDEKGKRIWKGGMGDTRRVPYRLPELLMTDEVIVVEGEKDVDVLVEQADRVATCNPMGAGKWRAEYARYFKGKRVYVVPDQDEEGRKHAEQVARSLVDVAQSVMLVDLPEGVKDAAELAQANGQAFSEKLSELLKESRPFVPSSPQSERSQESSPRVVSPRELIDTPPDPAQTLLGSRFLCRGGAMLFVGPSGIGKSSASIQQDILWSNALPAFGIAPARALRILVIQAEDDDGDLYEMITGVIKGLELSDEQIERYCANCRYVTENSHTGDEFLHGIVEPLLEQSQFDILRVNPLQAYLGGDIKDPKTTAAFLRNGLNPLLTRSNCGLILVHHTPKITFRDTSEWKASDWMYAGAGAADITNWARAALVIDPTTNPQVFKFIAAKRASRIGWFDEMSLEREFERYFAHGGDGIFWRDAIAEEAQSAKDAPRKALDVLALVPEEGSINKNALLSKAGGLVPSIGDKKARGFIAQLVSDGLLFEWHIPRPRTNQEVRLARYEQPPIQT